MIVACSDSRVDPAIMTSAEPGEIFVVRNVANLVPPYEDDQSGFHGVSAALEFAVVDLKVENVIVLGHRQCGGIRSLFPSAQEAGSVSTEPRRFVSQWMKIAESARLQVLQENPQASIEQLCRKCELQSIKVSLENLRTFPFIIEAIKTRDLKILGAYFDLELGQMFEHDDLSGEFRSLEL